MKASADWFVTSLDALRDALPRYRVAMIGSGELSGWASCRLDVRAQPLPLHALQLSLGGMWAQGHT